MQLYLLVYVFMKVLSKNSRFLTEKSVSVDLTESFHYCYIAVLELYSYWVIICFILTILSQILCVNCSYTYEVAPVFVLMELEVLRGLRQLVGWTEGDGLFCPGGSISNMYAMNLARYQLFPEVKSQGLWGLPRLTIFTSIEVRNGC